MLETLNPSINRQRRTEASRSIEVRLFDRGLHPVELLQQGVTAILGLGYLQLDRFQIDTRLLHAVVVTTPFSGH